MSGSVNKAIIIGNLGSDPEIRQTRDGRSVANLRVATNETWKDRITGERQERTEWHRVTIFSEGLTRIVESYLRKGSKVYIEGQIRTRKWQDRDGNDRYSTEIVLQNYNGVLHMLDSRSDGRHRDDYGYDQQDSHGGSYGSRRDDYGYGRQDARGGGRSERDRYDDGHAEGDIDGSRDDDRRRDSRVDPYEGDEDDIPF